jgi:hypothetical protein
VEDREAQLAWERRFGPFAGAAAFGAVILSIAAQAVSASASGPRNSQREQLQTLHDHSGAALAGTVLQSLAVFLVALVVLYLVRCVRHRRPEGVPSVIEPLVIAAPFLITLADIVSQMNVTDIADTFLGAGARTEKRADELLTHRGTLPIFISIGGHIALGFGMLLSSLNAMRVGLVTRFTGIIGIAVGALNALPVFPGVAIIQIFWLGAVGAIFLGRWPGGRGEAWETGEAGIWLSASEQRRQAMRAEKLEAEPAPGNEDDDERDEHEDPDGRPHPPSKKRRRKRRG